MASKIKITFRIIIILIVIYFLGYFFMSPLIDYIHEKDYTHYCELPNAQLYVNNGLKYDNEVLEEIKELVELSILSVDSIFLPRKEKVKVFLAKGNDSAHAKPQSNKITLYNSDDCFAAFCHEYLHITLGIHKELWFTEGVATYLGQIIRNRNSQLKKFCDSDDLYLDGSSEEIAGNFLMTVRIKKKYDSESIKELLFNTNTSLLLNDKNTHEFYFMSTSLSQYIFEEIGFNEMVKILVEMRSLDNSLVTAFERNDIDLSRIIDNWLIAFQK